MEEQPVRTVREMDAGRTSLTQEVRLVPALVLLKSRTKSTSERKSCAWCCAGLPPSELQASSSIEGMVKKESAFLKPNDNIRRLMIVKR